MKQYLKFIAGIIAAAGICDCVLAADVTTYPGYAQNNYATPSYSPTYTASNSIATPPAHAVAVALNAQALLLKELEQEHQKRAADLTQNNQAEKAKWESDLVGELHEKSVRVQKGIDQATQSSPGASELKAAGDIDDKLIFVSAVEARLEQLRQELSAATEDGRVLTVQMGTNKAPEDIGNLLLALNENQKVVKQLQNQQLDLELRKLEFRAICKAMQK